MPFYKDKGDNELPSSSAKQFITKPEQLLIRYRSLPLSGYEMYQFGVKNSKGGYMSTLTVWGYGGSVAV